MMQTNTIIPSTVKKALTTPNPHISGLSSYCEADTLGYLKHTVGFKFKTVGQILVN